MGDEEKVSINSTPQEQAAQRDQDDPVLLFRLKDEDLLEAPDDSAFLQSLRFSCARVNGVYPPLALAEAFITEEDSAPRVQRLHLIVVDLHRRRRLADRVRRLFSDIQVDGCANESWNTLPIQRMPNQEAYQLRYVFGDAMDGSDLPCYILWPTRTVEQSFWCIDAWKGDWVRSFIAPVGIEHFFDAFCLHPQRPWRAAACQALSIPPAMLVRTPIWIDMVATEESGSEAESGWSGVSDNSSADSECTNLEASSVASDQDRFDTAYEAFHDQGLYIIDLMRHSRGVTSEDASGPVTEWTGEAARVGEFASDLAISATDYPTCRAQQTN